MGRSDTDRGSKTRGPYRLHGSFPNQSRATMSGWEVDMIIILVIMITAVTTKKKIVTEVLTTATVLAKKRLRARTTKKTIRKGRRSWWRGQRVY